MAVTLHHWKAGTLSEDQLFQVAELHFAAFGSKGRTIQQYVDTRLRDPWCKGAETSPSPPLLHVLVADGRLVAKAATFGRTILTAKGPRDVLGLAAVASHPELRGSGLGKRVVTAALERVDRGEYPIALFQTGTARSFYEKLGCRVVNNRFVNSRCKPEKDANASPWWDSFVMIYPDHAEWPEGEIDLNGPGY